MKVSKSCTNVSWSLRTMFRTSPWQTDESWPSNLMLIDWFTHWSNFVHQYPAIIVFVIPLALIKSPWPPAKPRLQTQRLMNEIQKSVKSFKISGREKVAVFPSLVIGIGRSISLGRVIDISMKNMRIAWSWLLSHSCRLPRFEFVGTVCVIIDAIKRKRARSSMWRTLKSRQSTVTV